MRVVKKKIFIIASAIIIVAVAIGVFLHNQRQTSFDISITVPAGSQERFVYSDEIICPTGRTITIWAGENLGDTEVVLLPVKVQEKTAYTPQYLTHGMPVKIDVQKGAWYKVGISRQNTGTEDIEEYVTVDCIVALIE